MRALSLRRALREPLLHFLLLGAAIYGVYFLAAPAADEAPENRITVTAGEIEWLATTWEKRWTRPPTTDELTGLLHEYVRETIFYREALAMGLDRDDTIIRRRLAQKLEFLSRGPGLDDPPTDEELLAWFAKHAERYALPALTTFTHVFVDPDKRGDRTLRRTPRPSLPSSARRDRPPRAPHRPVIPSCSSPTTRSAPRLEVAKLFGSEFAQQRRAASSRVGGTGRCSPGTACTWSTSDQRSQVVPAEFAAVHDRVQQDWEDDRRREVRRGVLRELCASATRW